MNKAKQQFKKDLDGDIDFTSMEDAITSTTKKEEEDEFQFLSEKEYIRSILRA